ncbi:MAG: HipA N-terminal domain-containing protein [Clostridia bacterium]|nr:HipA N-terminal domain-containing protein [Clostridia bacterium]
MNGFRKAAVFVRDRCAGILAETDAGYRFEYDPSYLAHSDAVPVSLTLPLQTQPYEAKVLFPFFDGLIPEGWLLHIVSRNWKLDQNDRFGLLMVSCRDCVGAVRIEEAEE